MCAVKPILAVTMGDPAGSGPELVLKSLRRDDVRAGARFVLIGDLRVFEKAADILGIRDFKFFRVSHPSEAFDDPLTFCVVDLNNVNIHDLVYGKPSRLGGGAAYASIEMAIAFALKGDVHAIVTAPISKESLSLAGYAYPGHTEILADLTGAREVRMMLVAGAFRIVHVTTHVSMRRAIEMVTRERVLRTIEIAHENLRDLFGIPRPRIAVSGLNPHAGENGLFGDEEIREIAPAIQEASAKGVDALGPYPPDTVFYRTYDGQFDVAVAMLHDQGHIAMKMIGLMEGVNVTLGPPIIRTSPDHGTVWGKAGKGTADENATVQAIKLAAELARRSKSGTR